MTRQDNPEYFHNVCKVIDHVFKAEHFCNERGLSERLKAKEITPEEYIEAIADELIQGINPEDIE